jgi:hypothetical protein
LNGGTLEWGEGTLVKELNLKPGEANGGSLGGGEGLVETLERCGPNSCILNEAKELNLGVNGLFAEDVGGEDWHPDAWRRRLAP